RAPARWRRRTPSVPGCRPGPRGRAGRPGGGRRAGRARGGGRGRAARRGGRLVLVGPGAVVVVEDGTVLGPAAGVARTGAASMASGARGWAVGGTPIRRRACRPISGKGGAGAWGG